MSHAVLSMVMITEYGRSVVSSIKNNEILNR